MVDTTKSEQPPEEPIEAGIRAARLAVGDVEEADVQPEEDDDSITE